MLHAASRSAFPSSPIAALTLHIGLSAGEIWAARLGGDQRWQLLLAGPAVREACAASARASQGQTVIAPDAGPFVAPSAERTADPERPADDSATAGHRPLDPAAHIPKRVQEYAGEGYSAWIPQRRTICALFIRIDGLDDTAPDALTSHQAVVTSLNVALRPYTGSSGTLL